MVILVFNLFFHEKDNKSKIDHFGLFFHFGSQQ